MKIQHIANSLNDKRIPYRRDRYWNDKNVKKLLRTTYFGEGHFKKIINHHEWKMAQEILDRNLRKFNSTHAPIHEIRSKSMLHHKVFHGGQLLQLYYHEKWDEYVWADPKQWYQLKNKQGAYFVTNKRLESEVKRGLKYLRQNTEKIMFKDDSEMKIQQLSQINQQLEQLYRSSARDEDILRAIGEKCEILYSTNSISDEQISTQKMHEVLQGNDLSEQFSIIKRVEILNDNLIKLRLINKQIIKITMKG